MKNITTKISVLVIACTLITAAATSLLNFSRTNSFIKLDSEEIITDSCRETSKTINAYLSSVEQSVDTLAEIALSTLDSLDEFSASDANVDAYTETLAPALLSAAEHTDGAMSSYIRYNPELAYPTSGKFYMKSSQDSPYHVVDNTDFSVYDKTDLNHVGWYYIPVNNGKPTWMAPYHNDNVNIYMISYVVPLYKDGINLGILGMDIDFSFFQSLASAELIYDDPTFFIVDSDNTILYHRDFEYGTKLAEIDPNGGMQPVIDSLTKDALLTAGSYNGQKYLMSYQNLDNGMKLILSVPADNVNVRRNTLFIIMVVTCFVTVAISAAAALLISRRMSKPIHQLSDAVKKIADGDLSTEITVTSNDEIGELARNFSQTAGKLHSYVDYINEISDVLDSIASGDLGYDLTMDYVGEFEKIKISLLNISDTLNTTMADINAAAVEVALGSEQVSGGAQSLAQSSTQQTASIQDLSSSIDSLTQDVVLNNRNIHSAFNAMEKALANINESSNNMSEMHTAMNAISEASEKISNIVKTVDDIALQTNILAINAAIEAGRAGEAGRGFSVVSAEIQTLAAKTSSATNEINDLVDNVRKTVEDGRRISEKADESLQSVTNTASVVQNALSKISQSSEKQSDSIESINTNIQQISDVVQNNTATAQQSAAASEKMNAEAHRLHEKISIFKLRQP